LDRAETVRSELSAATSMLEESMSSQVTKDCREALARIGEAEAELTALGEAASTDATLIQQGQQALVDMESRDAEAARRDAAKRNLEAAVRTREASVCLEALVEAHAAGLASCPVMELAQVLANTEQLHKALAKEGASRILEDRRGLSLEGRGAGLEVEDFAAAAAASAAVLTKEQLRRRAADLAAALATSNALRARELEAALQSAEAELRERSTARMNEALEHFASEQTRSFEEKKALLEAYWKEHTEQAKEAAVAEVMQEAEKRSEEMRREVLAQRHAVLANEREEFAQRRAALEEPLRLLEGLIGKGMTLQQRSQASTALAGALLALQGALFEGRSLYTELRVLQGAGATDAFVARLLSLLPAETVNFSKTPVPTAIELTHSFRGQLRDFSAAAFAPPVSGEFSQFFGSLASYTFSRLYVLKAQDVPATGDSEVRKNLEVLSKAAKFVEQGELREALAAMEASLTGQCRERAKGWMAEARNALLLHQASRALQAKARCLNAVLS